MAAGDKAMSHGHCFYFFRGVDPGGELAEMRTMGGPRWLDEPRIGRISRHGKHISGPNMATVVIRRSSPGEQSNHSIALAGLQNAKETWNHRSCLSRTSIIACHRHAV